MSKILFRGFCGFVVFAAVAAGLGGLWYAMMLPLFAGGEQKAPPSFVDIGEVVQMAWERTIPAVGTVAAYQGIAVCAEAEGTVREIAFTAGSRVEAGAVLVRLDTDVEESQLRAAEASARLAKSNAARASELFATRSISQAEFDAAQAALDEAEARADNVRAIIDEKTIRAPFAGRLGIRQINLGQLVARGQPVVSLQALDPVFVEFSLPQQHLARLKQGLAVRVAADAYPGEAFAGTITAIDPEVDAATRNVRIQTTVPNPAERLRPGMFVGAEVILPETAQVLVVPATAVLYAPYGDTVFTVAPGEAGAGGSRPLVADQKIVRIGERRGDFVVVTEGLQAGDRIVTTGAFKLRKGATVVESKAGVPQPSMAPKPPEA
jgi:membrane fusion protein (multidrug efflux system)